MAFVSGTTGIDASQQAALAAAAQRIPLTWATNFSLSVAVLAEQRVIIAAPVPEVLAFDHPFIHHFFLGERGQRAMELLRDRRTAATPQGH